MTDLPDIRHLQTQSTDHHWRPSAEHPKEENVYRKHNRSTLVITCSSWQCSKSLPQWVR